MDFQRTEKGIKPAPKLVTDFELTITVLVCCDSACAHAIQFHYADGCCIPDCKCKWTFGATTLPDDNEPKQYKD